MSNLSSEQSSATPVFLTPSSSINSSGVQIPEPKDGFFGYTDEKSLQQVYLNQLLKILSLIMHRWKKNTGSIGEDQMLIQMQQSTRLYL